MKNQYKDVFKDFIEFIIYFLIKRQNCLFSSEIDLLNYYTVPKVIDFPRYNMKCSGENVILRGIFHVVSCFPLHFMLYSGNLDYFSDSAPCCVTRSKKAFCQNHYLPSWWHQGMGPAGAPWGYYHPSLFVSCNLHILRNL